MGKGGDDYVVVGYKYYIGLHHVICHGPGEDSTMTCKEIAVGDKTLATPDISSNTALLVDEPNLFGGKKKEGGIVGTISLLFGGATQPANAYLVENTTGPHPAYRGVFSTVWEQPYIAANNPYLKTPSYRVKRIFNGWYPSKAECSNGGMNPAHIVYECVTNSAWGSGYSSSDIDEAALIEAADTLYSEGFGLCLAWTNQSSVEEFLQEIMDHIAGIWSVNPFTGQFTLTLIRESGSSGLKTIDTSNSTLLDRQAPAWGNTTNKVTVTYFDIEQRTDRTVTQHDPGNIRAQGRVVPLETNYMGIPNESLAARVCLRDLRMLSTPLNKFELEVNREGWDLRPGQTFTYSNPDKGISSMVLRVGSISLGTLTSGKIKISAIQDIFSMPDTSYSGAEPIGWVPAFSDPIEPPYREVIESPYWVLKRKMSTADLDQLGILDTFVGGIASRPTNLSYNYEYHTHGSSSSYAKRSVGGWCPTFELTSAVGEDEEESVVLIQEISDGEQAETGRMALLGTELVWVTSIDPSLTSVTVKRGINDTVPTTHPIGEILFFFQTYDAKDPTLYVEGETVWSKFLTQASGGLLPIGDATEETITLQGRQGRPYPPGNVKVNGALFAASFTGEFSSTWSHRDRLLQVEDTPLFWSAGDIGPEPGTTYTLDLYGSGGAYLRTVTGLTDPNYTYLLADEIADSDLTVGVPVQIPVLNGDAEYGDMTGWSVLIGDMGTSTISGGYTPYEGTYMFIGKVAAYVSMLSDAMDLLAEGLLAADIDADKAYIDCQWWQRSYSSSDPGRNGIRFYAADGITEISTSWDGWKLPFGWTHYSHRVPIPAGTRYVGILFDGERNAGSYNSVYFDKIELFYDVPTDLNVEIRMVLKSVRDGQDSYTVYDRTIPRVT